MKPYLYETLHVMGRDVRLLADHLHRMGRSYRTLFGGDVELSEATIGQRVVELLEQGRYPRSSSTYVEIRLMASGEWSLHPHDETLYRGYVVRALHPEALTLKFDLPYADHTTSASRATWQLATEQAQLQGLRSVVRLTAENLLAECDAAPLFAGVGRTLYCTARPHGVYGELALEAIQRAGYPLCCEPLDARYLDQIEELFYLDYRGVTALKSCNGHRMMAAMAENVARVMEAIFHPM